MGNDSPIMVCDIGARGSFHPRWRQIAHRLHAVAIDADPRAVIEEPECAAWRAIPVALWHSAQELPFYKCRSLGASSFYRPNMEFVERFANPRRCDIVSVGRMKTERLDTLGIRPHFIKIDTQGAELNILQGATGILSTAIGMEIELEFHPIYEGAPLFPEIDKFMSVAGFELWDMNSYYWRDLKDGRMRQVVADALYFKRPELIHEREIFTALAHCYRVTKRQALAHAFQWITRAFQKGYPWDCDMQLGH